MLSASISLVRSMPSTRDGEILTRVPDHAGNPLKAGFFTEPCYNLVYLELAACRLTRLPEELSKLVPNLRVLNLNYNFLEDARPLEGLTRLRKLTIIGSRLKGTKALIRLLQRMVDIEMLDFRYVHVHIEWMLSCFGQNFVLNCVICFTQDEPMHVGMVPSTSRKGCAWCITAIGGQCRRKGRKSGGIHLARAGLKVPSGSSG
jgi:hypothetical protein